MVNRDNIVSIYERRCASIGERFVDVLSIDLDGNDYYFVDRLLKAVDVKPKLIIVKYSAKFIPPIEFCIEYDENHVWQGDDYFGASLQSYKNLLSGCGYRLVCCNSATGANAFFVLDEYKEKFSDVPTAINEIYVPQRYYLPGRKDHPISHKAVEFFVKRLE